MAMTTFRHNLFVIGALALGLTALGCTSGPPATSPSPTPSATPDPAGVLLTVETRGGMCAPGPCGTSIFVERDGRVHVAAKPPNGLGIVSPDALAALDAQIQATDFAELESHPFTGECPTAYDGQEIVFEFAAPDRVHRIATCEVELDFDSPLFEAVAGAVGQFISLPIE